MKLNNKFALSLVALTALFSTSAFASGSVSTTEPVKKEMQAEDIMAKEESAKDLMVKQEMAQELMGKDLSELTADELASLEEAIMAKKDDMVDDMTKEVMGNH